MHLPCDSGWKRRRLELHAAVFACIAVAQLQLDTLRRVNVLHQIAAVGRNSDGGAGRHHLPRRHRQRGTERHRRLRHDGFLTAVRLGPAEEKRTDYGNSQQHDAEGVLNWHRRNPASLTDSEAHGYNEFWSGANRAPGNRATNHKQPEPAVADLPQDLVRVRSMSW